MQDGTELLIGARDWEHPAWCGDFYPDDLPEDWRLTYYANEFMSVLLPAERWVDAREEAVEEWCDSVHDRFTFFLELPGGEGAVEDLPVRLKAVAAVMGDLLKGVLWPPAASEQGLEACRAVLPGITFYRGSTQADLPEGVSAFRCLDGADDASADLLLLEPGACGDLRKLRALLEGFDAGRYPGCTGGLFVAGDAPVVERIREIVTLSQLLGIA
ncbi:MAG: hypothetical protein ABW085_10945 [Sedimenticola sp.]